MSNCPFCNIIEGEQQADIVLESDDHICIRDKYPVTEGHCLVMPKEHVERLEAADGPELYGFLERAHAEVKRQFDPDATNLGLNNGPEAGQTISHLHWHVIPRYHGDVEDPRGGVRGVIPSKQKY